MVKNEALKPSISKVFELSNINEAYDAFLTRSSGGGKIVVDIAGDK